jgi:hypothetical protein
MKRLSAADLKAWEEHRAEAEKAHDELMKAHNDFSDAVAVYNDAISELTSLATTRADYAEAHQQERSERWQEGEAGQDYSAWAEQLRALADGFETLEPPDEPDTPDWLNEDPPEEP